MLEERRAVVAFVGKSPEPINSLSMICVVQSLPFPPQQARDNLDHLHAEPQYALS